MGLCAGCPTACVVSVHETSGLPKKDIKVGGIGRAQFIMDNPGLDILEQYDMSRDKLGEGSYGAVYKATKKDTRCARAIKTVSKAQVKNVELFRQEIAIMKMMDHPHILKLYETYEDQRNIYLVLELCEGGELFERIIATGRLTEANVAGLMQQVVRALCYMHKHRVCHRDLKPENFLFLTADPIDRNVLKLIDFGLARVCASGQLLSTKVGTPFYVSPQVLEGAYDYSTDMWSMGVIMYTMLCGYPPFGGETESKIFDGIRTGRFSFPAAEWQDISADAKNLIRKLLAMDPEARITADEALKHSWISGQAPKAELTLRSDLVNKLRGFRSQNKFKKAALHIIAGQLRDDDIKALRGVFTALDTNGDGMLTIVEMRDGLNKAGIKDIPADLQQILEDVDSDGSGVIDYTEFLAATLDKKAYIQEDVCWSAFRLFDKNGDGTISVEELKTVLNTDDVQTLAGPTAIRELMTEIDGNGDGMIDFDEFMCMMRVSVKA